MHVYTSILKHVQEYEITAKRPSIQDEPHKPQTGRIPKGNPETQDEEEEEEEEKKKKL